jgi:hypothetical protein
MPSPLRSRRAVTAAALVTALALALTGISWAGIAALSGDSDRTPAAGAPGGEAPASEPGSAGSASPSAGPDRASRAFLDRLASGMGEEGTVHVRMTMRGPATSFAEGDTRYGPDGNEMRLAMATPEAGEAPMELLVVADRAYLSMPGVTEKGRFFEVPQDSDLVAGLTGGPGGILPSDSFAAFEAGLTRVDQRGRERLGGTPTERYRLHVDTERALAAQGVPVDPGLPETLVYDVWLDRQDRMRRLEYGVAGAQMTMELSDWGRPVTIEAPAEGDLVEPPPGL